MVNAAGVHGGGQETELADTATHGAIADDSASNGAEELRQQTPRVQFIQAAIKSGVISDVEFRHPGTTVWIGANWSVVDDRTREMICPTASDFARTGYRCGFVAVSVRDAGLGREVARYEERGGTAARLRPRG
jgi:hypothetical protein